VTAGPSFFTVGDRGVLLRVKARPHARKDAVEGVRAGELVVSVRAAPEKGRANDEIVRVLAEALGLPRTSVVLKSGAGSHHKVVVLPGEARTALERLAGARRPG